MKKLFPGILAMATIVVVSNILVQFFIGNWLTWGAFTYPFAFLVTDIINRMYGPSDARRVVFFGFIVGIICSMIGTQINIEIAPDFMAPAVTIRIAIGSGTAFLVAQLIDVNIFDRLRRKVWFAAPLVSSLIGSGIDTFLFFSISFYGTGVNWVTLSFGDLSVKIFVALAMLIPFRLLLGRVKAV